MPALPKDNESVDRLHPSSEQMDTRELNNLDLPQPDQEELDY